MQVGHGSQPFFLAFWVSLWVLSSLVGCKDSDPPVLPTSKQGSSDVDDVADAQGKLKAGKWEAALIEQTAVIGDEMATNPQCDVQRISVLIDLLERLQRPLEALGWRGIQVAYGRESSMLTDEAARNVLQMLNQKRVEHLANEGVEAKRSFLTGGLKLQAAEK